MNKPAKVEYKVSYFDRIYGYKCLHIMAFSEQEAIGLAIEYVGFTPHNITAHRDIELHSYAGMTTDD